MDPLDDLYDSVGDLVEVRDFTRLEAELREVDIPSTNIDILLGYLTCILSVSNSELSYVQDFRDAAVAELSSRPHYEPALTHGLEEYSSKARDASEFLGLL